MTYEKALDELDKTFTGNLELKVVLTTALLRRIPKHPTLIEKRNLSRRFFIFGCPNCKEFVGHDQRCCAWCGQALDCSFIEVEGADCDEGRGT